MSVLLKQLMSLVQDNGHARAVHSLTQEHRLSRRSRSRRPPKLAKEIPRLCRGGSKSLTFPAVARQAPIDETSGVSRQAHAQSPIDGRQWESVKHGDKSARCFAAFVPRYRGRNCTLSSDANQNRGASGIHEPPSGGPRIGGAPATPI